MEALRRKAFKVVCGLCGGERRAILVKFGAGHRLWRFCDKCDQR